MFISIPLYGSYEFNSVCSIEIPDTPNSDEIFSSKKVGVSSGTSSEVVVDSVIGSSSLSSPFSWIVLHIFYNNFQCGLLY